ncbi:copper amine oxidase N-terminal domain-containing protein [Anaerotignum lactatifermentans]|uniref:copper amine oxidase N-terminal domain-containing protein n=1 Tax=Anaerotignum lactatifermentans TaxID=160404 RepID=UPI0018744397|nr:copper amine oxidase N-terminal domain-containing protein [Anaerotignum lactatifermentans]MBE5076180.1 copper amine oxidase N-terminal domain-containing protein [Anaerotignum lactatifermentans]
MKKFLSMVMAAAMVVSLVPATAFAAADDVRATAKVVDAQNYTETEIETANSVASDAELQLTFTTADYTAADFTADIDLTLDNAYFVAGTSLKANDMYVKVDGSVYVGQEAAAQNGIRTITFTGAGLDGADVVLKVPSVAGQNDADEITVTLEGKLDRGAVLAIGLDTVMDKISKGKTATISVDSDDIRITNGDDLVYASVEAKSIKASVKDTKDVATEEIVTLKDVKIEPGVGDYLGTVVSTSKDNNGNKYKEIKLKLNGGFEFANKDVTDKKVVLDGATATDISYDEDEIVLTFAETGLDATKTLTVKNLMVEATSAKAGSTATLKVYATGNDTVSVEVAKVVDYAVTMSVDEDEDVPVIYSGVDVDNTGITDDSEHESLEVTIKETFAGAWNHSKEFTLALPEGVYVADVKSPNLDNSTADGGEYTWFKNAYDKGDFETLTFAKRSWTETDPDAKQDPIELTFTLVLVADPNFEGDVTLKLTGDAVEEQTVTVAKFVKPFTVEAQQNDLQIDYRNTDIPTSVVIKEAEAGLWKKGTTFQMALDKIEFDDDAKFTVDSKSGLEIKNEKTNKGVISFEVAATSDDEPASVTISDLTLYMERNLPAGAYDLSVYSNTMLGAKGETAANDVKGYLSVPVFGADIDDKDDVRVIADINDDFYSTTAKAGFVNIVTAGREDTESFTTKVVVPVGESYLISGENKVTIDVPAYINANGYTMLPLRAVAVALGINSNNVLWDQSTRTATIMYGSKIINMTYGQKVVYVNGAMIPATAAVEITNDRMFLGLRDLGNALGVTDITWDGATKTATLNGNK